jgi:diacylglycerol kinase family enzyme
VLFYNPLSGGGKAERFKLAEEAIVAMVAAEHDLPYACIPSGTRNHFALDLGVDRNDVVGALEAFVNGGERRVDLAEVNGRVFVNNVSLGLYADAVQRTGYREAKIRTLLDSVPEAFGPDARPPTLFWDGAYGRESAVAVVVSNNPYRLGRAIGSGTRPA